MVKRALTNLKATGGAIIRFMKYASTPAELATCGHALHRVIDLYEHDKKASRSRSVPKPPDDLHAWDRGTRRPACVKCGQYQDQVIGTPCDGDTSLAKALSETEPKASTCEHDWDADALTARRQCRTCGQFWIKLGNGVSCPGRPLPVAPTPDHEWTLVEGHVRCCKCQTQQTKAATLESCPGVPDPLQKTHPSHTWIPGDPGDGDCGHCGAGRRGKLAREPCKDAGRHDWVVQPTGRPKCAKCGVCQREGRMRRCPGAMSRGPEHDWDGMSAGPPTCRKCGIVQSEGSKSRCKA